MIFQAGPQIKPRYVGRLFGLLFNLSAEEQSLVPGEELWSIDFTAITENPQELASNYAEGNLSIASYIEGGRLPTNGLTRLGKEFNKLEAASRKVDDAAGKLELEINQFRKEFEDKQRQAEQKLHDDQTKALIAELTKANTTNSNLTGSLDKQQSNRQLMFFGGFLVLFCAFIPMIISKTMYDKDEFVNLVEGRATIQGYKESINAEMQKKNIEVQELHAQLQALKAQIAAKTPDSAGRLKALSVNKPAAQRANNQH